MMPGKDRPSDHSQKALSSNERLQAVVEVPEVVEREPDSLFAPEIIMEEDPV